MKRFKRWEMLVRDAKGDIHSREPFYLRRNALFYARRMQSPIYTVEVQKTDGTHHSVVAAHMDPDEFVAMLRRGDSPFQGRGGV